jgi:hypothetical protein
MKKLLLSALALSFMMNVNAQNRVAKFSQNKNFNPNFVKEIPLAKNSIPKVSAFVAPQRNGAPSPTTFSSINIGMAANSYTNAFSPKEPLYYDPNLNTITFTHRGDGTLFGSGLYIVDKSTDGGTNWSVNQGPVYDNLSGLGGRYPQGVIYNPAGNTDPANAYLFATGPTLMATNGASWGGYANGSYKIDGSTAAVTSETSITNYVGTAGGSQAWENRNGDFWEASEAIDLINNVVMGQVIVFHGVWNGTTYTVTTSTLSYPTSNTYGGDCDISFGADGMTGYIVAMDGLVGADPTVILPYIWKTTDAGANWTALGYLDLNALGVDFSGAALITCHSEVDIAVDASGNLHIATVAAIPDATLIWAQTMNNFAIYDLHTTDGGTTWFGTRVAYPAMYGGAYGADNGGYTQSLGVQTSATWAGDKLFISWSETDPTLDPANNIYPDLWTAGLDLTTGMWTDKIDLTPSALNIYYHTLAPFVSGATGSYRLHAIYQAITDPTISLTPPQFAYLTLDPITDAQFTITPTPIPITMVTGIAHNDPGVSGISNVYPNPSTDVSYLDINLSKSENASMQITNVMGQVVRSIDLGKLNTGKNQVSVSTKSLSSGVYSVNIKTASMSVVRNFVIN